MPKVGNQNFPYTKEGIAEARAASKSTGQPIKGRLTYREQAHLSVAKAKKAAAAKASLAGAPVTGSDTGGEQVAPMGGAIIGRLRAANKPATKAALMTGSASRNEPEGPGEPGDSPAEDSAETKLGALRNRNRK